MYLCALFLHYISTKKYCHMAQVEGAKLYAMLKFSPNCSDRTFSA